LLEQLLGQAAGEQWKRRHFLQDAEGLGKIPAQNNPG